MATKNNKGLISASEARAQLQALDRLYPPFETQDQRRARRLKQRALGLEDFTEEDIALISQAEVPVEYAHLDALMGDMASLSKDTTGVDNTVFISTKAYYPQHAARIVIAADPPRTFNPHSKSALMVIDGYGLTGEYLPPHIIERAKQFIERNREVLLRYWDCKISTAKLLDSLKPREPGLISD